MLGIDRSFVTVLFNFTPAKGLSCLKTKLNGVEYSILYYIINSESYVFWGHVMRRNNIEHISLTGKVKGGGEQEGDKGWFV